MKRKLIFSVGLVLGLGACTNHPESKTNREQKTQSEALKNYYPFALDTTKEKISVRIVADGNKPTEMRRSPDKMELKSGTMLSLRLVNHSDAYKHNLVLVQEGFEDTVATAGLQTLPAKNFVAKNSPGLILNSPLILPHDSVTILFMTPPAGRYAIFCTVPGHSTLEQIPVVVK